MRSSHFNSVSVSDFTFHLLLTILLPSSHPFFLLIPQPDKKRHWFWIGLRSISEKAMAPHSSTLAWKIPWTEEPGRLQSMGSLSRTRLSDFTFTFHFHALEKEMATHSSVLAWRIPGTGKPGGLPSMGVAQSRTWLKWLSSSSNKKHLAHLITTTYGFSSYDVARSSKL